MVDLTEDEDTDEIVIVDGTKSSGGVMGVNSEHNSEKVEVLDQPKQERKFSSFRLLIPDGEFTCDDIKSLNAHHGTGPMVYIKLIGAVEHGVVELVRKEKIPGRPGRPTNIYRKIGN